MLLVVPALMKGAPRYVGGDISLLPEYEKAGAQYKDLNGNRIADLLQFCTYQGMNAMRVRLFVEPKAYKGSDKDPNACQDIEYILPLCKRIKDAGCALMLDFHYSDTWADPAKQWTPQVWQDLDDQQLARNVYEYTRSVLQKLKANGSMPDFIQTGNEISYGMLWGAYDAPESTLKKTFINSDANWDRLIAILKHAVTACREECPNAQIVLHTERVAQPDVQEGIYDRLAGIDYDIIGVSYYPYFHGDLKVLGTALDRLCEKFPSKKIMIVETGYPYKWEVPGSNFDFTGEYPYSEAGQKKFADDLVNLLLKYDQVNGLFWWWMEYNAFGTSLAGWYNAPLFDSTTGKVTSAFKAICRFGTGAGIESIHNGSEEGAGLWFDINGRRVNRPGSPGIYVNTKGDKIKVR